MPQIQNLSLKDRTAGAIVGLALVPSAGDQSPARWRVESAKPPFARATVEMQSRFNQKRTARYVDVKITFPYTVTDSATSQEVPVATGLFTGQLILPMTMASASSDDLVAYVSSFFADAGVISSLKAGYAPT